MICDAKDLQAITAVIEAFKEAQFLQITGKDIIAMNGALGQLASLGNRITEEIKKQSAPAPAVKEVEPAIKPIKGKK